MKKTELKSFAIPFNHITLGDKLGEGGFGVVYKATYLEADAAVKKLKTDTMTDQAKAEFLTETKIMSQLRSPFIVQLYGISTDPYAIVMEYMPKGSLFSLLHSKEPMEWTLRYSIGVDVGKGIYFLHSQKIIHRDLKSLNVLLDKHYQPKLCDFGLAKLKSESSTTTKSTKLMGTTRWKAPELFKRGNSATYASDIYAYGMILWEIASRQIPYQEESDNDTVINWIKGGEQEQIPSNCPQPYSDSIKASWHMDPAKRPDALTLIGLLKEGQKLQSEQELKPKEQPATSMSQLDSANITSKPSYVTASSLSKQEIESGPYYVPASDTQIISSPSYVISIPSISPTSSQSGSQNKTTSASTASLPGEADFHTGYTLFSKCQYKQSLLHFLKAAKEGYPPAFLYLYCLYDVDERIGPKNEKESKQWEAKAAQNIAWFQAQAKTNQPQAQFNLGFCYYAEIGVSKDYKKAAELYQKAADQGHVNAQYALGGCYYSGKGVPQDYKKAAELYQQAANQGNALAQYNLGWCYYSGKGVPQDYKKVAELYQQAAEQGLASAQYNLGWCYKNGEGVLQDYKKAAELYQQAADQGNVYAQYNLGNSYYHGQGVPQDYKKAAELYQQAADQGDVLAQFDLGACYEHGEGVPQDYKKAAELYQQAADQGDVYAQYNLGVCYDRGQGVPQDYKKAAELYQQAAEQGLASAQYNLGNSYYHGQGVSQDYKKAAELYQQAAEQRDADAQYKLGMCYYHGQGVPQDYKKAAELYQKAADQGHVSAQFSLGVCYEDGRGVTQDYKKAAELYQQAAEQGLAVAQYNLGNSYYHGQGVPQDYKRGVELFQKAAEQGNADAQNNLGVCYENGRGVTQDYKKTAELYQKAAEQGLASAQYGLALCYKHGRGVPQDYQKAAELYQQAADQGNAGAQDALKKLLENHPELKISMNQSITFFKPTDTNNNNLASSEKKDEKNMPTKKQ